MPLCACVLKQRKENEKARASATIRTPETERKENCKNSRDTHNSFRQEGSAEELKLIAISLKHLMITELLSRGHECHITTL